MKQIIIILIFQILSFNMLAEGTWKKITVGSNGYVFYIDLNSLEERGGKVFFWQLINYNKSDEYGDLSAKIHIESDCIKLRFRWIIFSYHKEAMGKDSSEPKKPKNSLARWQTPSPHSTSKSVLDYVCSSTGVTL